jgi:serine/threonine protein kinase
MRRYSISNDIDNAECLLFFCIGTTFVVDDKFEYIKQIGHGAYGVVCSAYDHKSKTKVAIKKVPKAFEDLIDAKRIVREIKLLSNNALINALKVH